MTQQSFGAALVALALASCTTWKPAGEYEGWTLYVEDGSEVDFEAYSGAFTAAFVAVEEVFGPFTGNVDVHAIAGSVDLHSGNRGTITGEEGAVEYVEGIGEAPRARPVLAGTRRGAEARLGHQACLLHQVLFAGLELHLETQG